MALMPHASKERNLARPQRPLMFTQHAIWQEVRAGEGTSHVGSQIRKPSAVGSTRAPWGRMLGRSSVDSSAVATSCMTVRIARQPIWALDQREVSRSPESKYAEALTIGHSSWY